MSAEGTGYRSEWTGNDELNRRAGLKGWDRTPIVFQSIVSGRLWWAAWMRRGTVVATGCGENPDDAIYACRHQAAVTLNVLKAKETKQGGSVA